MNKVILGIDPGYGRCGFGVVREEKLSLKCLAHGIISTPASMKFEKRLLEIGKDIDALLKKFKPSVLVMEEIFFAKNTTTALKVAEVRGMIQFLAAQKNIPVVMVKPNEVKMALTGYGKAQKHQMQQMVKTVFGLKCVPKPDDAADALAIAWTGAQKNKI